MNYPNNSKTNYNKTTNYANRGMDLEMLINQANQYYLDNDIAVIYKKPTPIGISKVKYINKKPIIDKSYFKEKSTLDYNGLYKGYYIDFDAKVTKNKTNFPLANIHPHQIEHIRRIIKHNGIAFLIIYMNDNYYLLPGDKLINYIDNNQIKTIPYDYINNNSYPIKLGINPYLDYIKAIDLIIKERS